MVKLIRTSPYFGDGTSYDVNTLQQVDEKLTGSTTDQGWTWRLEGTREGFKAAGIEVEEYPDGLTGAMVPDQEGNPRLVYVELKEKGTP